MKRMLAVSLRFHKCLYMRGVHKGHLANLVHENRRFVHQPIPAMNPAAVAGIGPFIGPFWPDSHQTEGGRAHVGCRSEVA